MRCAPTIVTEAYGAALVASFAAARASCPLTAIGTASVKAVRDGRTLQLADGRVLRLAAIDAPDASRALQALIGGRRLRLACLTLADAERDRRGRLVAFAGARGGFRPVQRPLLRRRASGHRTGGARGRRGLWANPNFASLAAENWLRLERKRGISR